MTIHIWPLQQVARRYAGLEETVNTKARGWERVLTHRLRTILPALALLASCGVFGELGSVRAAETGPARGSSLAEELSKSLGEHVYRYRVAVGDPEDPRTWTEQPYDPQTWQPLSRREPTNRKDIVAVTFNAVVTSQDELEGDTFPPGFHVTDKQVELLTKVKTLRRLVFLEARLAAGQLKVLSALPKLQVLVLRECGVTNRGLEWIGQMKELRSLEIRGEPIDAEGLKHLAGLSKLASFELDGPGVDDVTIAGLSRLKSLRYLTLGGKITDRGLAALAPLDSLEVLRFRAFSYFGVHGTGLKHLPSGTLRELSLPMTMSDEGLAAVNRFTQLRKLDVSGSPVTDEGLQSLRGLHGLESLDATSTKITGAGLENLVGLKRLSLTDAKITAKNCESLASLRALQYLSLSGTPVDGNCLKYLRGLQHLEELDAGGTRITNESLQHLDTLPALRSLNVSGCSAIDDGAARYLGKLVTLEQLTLIGTGITEASLPKFRGLTQLRSLYLPNVSGKIGRSDELKRLREALPKCDISYYPPGK